MLILIKRITTMLAAFVVTLGIALAPGPGAHAAGGPYSYAGRYDGMTAAERVSATGASARIQAWSIPTTCCYGNHALGELAVQRTGTATGTNRDMTVEVGYMNQNNTGLHLFVSHTINGVWQGLSTGFSACSTTVTTPGCTAPAWIEIDNALSSNGQYTMKWQYAHVGQSDEGWWLYVQGTGACPAGKTCWLGVYKKTRWSTASPAITDPGKIDLVQAFGETYDTGSHCTNMGTGGFAGAGTGALIDQLDVLGITTDDFGGDITTDPTWYNSLNVTTSPTLSFRYGGPGAC
ncbi:MAG: hypothetical protein ABWY81_06055 [Jiangellaceae bacterium]